jgi:hypothetical protein
MTFVSLLKWGSSPEGARVRVPLPEDAATGDARVLEGLHHRPTVAIGEPNAIDDYIFDRGLFFAVSLASVRSAKGEPL